MNKKMIIYILGKMMGVEGLLLLIPALVSLIYHEKSVISFLIVAAILLAIYMVFGRKLPASKQIYGKEGFVIVGLAWILWSAFGALPFVISGSIPHYIDALFETISGFTTTGSTILVDIEALPMGISFWRSFTHWIGGMGVFVFLLAILPLTGGYNMHLMRAESPGPSVGKFVPKVRETAKILYAIYIVMTLVEIILLLSAGMPLFDSLTVSFGTAGTGGFGIKNTSIADYNMVIQAIISIFMILFGVNFGAYFLLLGNNKKDAFKLEEVHWYLTIIAGAVAIITINTKDMFHNLFTAFHHALFQVASVITTTGYSTTDFDLWPQLSRAVLVIVMFIGACAGSTGGGIKVSRIIILVKSVKQELGYFIHPRSVKVIKMDNKPLSANSIRGVNAFFVTYTLIFVASLLIITFDNFDLVTNFTAVTATLNNIGPGLKLVGPTGNFGIFSPVAKYILMFDMLAGRLELYPILLLFTPSVWKKH